MNKSKHYEVYFAFFGGAILYINLQKEIGQSPKKSFVVEIALF